jgi:predicted dehydrogenase
MPLKVGMLGVAHIHAPSYIHCLRSSAEYVGHWDKGGLQIEGSKAWADREELIAEADALVIAGENLDHSELVSACVTGGRPVLCEKPLAASAEEAARIEKSVEGKGILVATAFPCPFAPAFESAIAKIEAGDIGRVLSVCATNHGKCPGGWFTDPAKSGGGAMIDHTVHVADLLRRIFAAHPETVQAFIGNNMHGQQWEDTAMLTIGYPGGRFASLDASWSRPESYKTWGDVTMKIVGEKGVIELDLFVQAADSFCDKSKGHGLVGFGSNLDQLMVDDFLRAVETGSLPRSTMSDGLAASRVALAGYESARKGQAVKLGDHVAV